MDLVTMIVDLLRRDEDAALGLEEERGPEAPSTQELAGQQLSNPAYALYKREALANGETPMSLEEFQAQQAGSR
jgi:hypothetical protein